MFEFVMKKTMAKSLTFAEDLVKLFTPFDSCVGRYWRFFKEPGSVDTVLILELLIFHGENWWDIGLKISMGTKLDCGYSEKNWESFLILGSGEVIFFLNFEKGKLVKFCLDGFMIFFILRGIEILFWNLACVWNYIK